VVEAHPSPDPFVEFQHRSIGVTDAEVVHPVGDIAADVSQPIEGGGSPDGSQTVSVWIIFNPRARRSGYLPVWIIFNSRARRSGYCHGQSSVNSFVTEGSSFAPILSPVALTNSFRYICQN
jgi:hypothetical protein